MRIKPIIIQVSGNEYDSDSSTKGRKALSITIYNNLKKKYNFVKLIDLFDLNINHNSGVALHNLYTKIYEENVIDIKTFNKVIKIMHSLVTVKLMISKTDRIIVIDNSIYDLVLDLTIKYILNFKGLFDNDPYLYDTLKTYMDPNINPFLVEFETMLKSFPIDIIVNYRDKFSVTRPKGEFSNELLQDVYSILYSHTNTIRSNDKMMQSMCVKVMDLHNENLESSSMEDRIKEFSELVITEIDKLMEA